MKAWFVLAAFAAVLVGCDSGPACPIAPKASFTCSGVVQVPGKMATVPKHVTCRADQFCTADAPEGYAVECIDIPKECGDAPTADCMVNGCFYGPVGDGPAPDACGCDGHRCDAQCLNP